MLDEVKFYMPGMKKWDDVPDIRPLPFWFYGD